MSTKILLTEEFVEQMLGDIQELGTRDEVRVVFCALFCTFVVVLFIACMFYLFAIFLQTKLPKEYNWPDKKLKISVLPDSVFDNPLQ